MLLLLTTYPNKPRDLKKFILGIIKGKMAACVQRINYVKSYYMREGKMMQEEEKILLIKLSEETKEKLLGYIKKNHPYEIPELVRLKPEEVSDGYVQWVKASVH